MPQIHELSSASTITSGNTLAMDTGTVTQKIDYNVLAKCIIEQYASSSLGGSAQSVKSAIDALKTDHFDLMRGTLISNGSDLDNLTTPGTYYCPSADNAKSYSNCPITSRGFKMVVMETGYVAPSYIIQTIYGGVSSGAGGCVAMYTRTYGGTSSGWTPWREEHQWRTFTATATLESQVDELPIYGVFKGTISSYGAQSATGVPENAAFYVKATVGGTNYRLIEITAQNANARQYIKYRNGSTWGDWVKQPTRTEIDSINAKRFVKNLSTGDNSFTLSNSFRGVLYTLDTVPASLTSAIIYSTSAGAFGRKQILSGDNITLSSTGANNLTVNVASGFPTLYVDVVSGTIS